VRRQSEEAVKKSAKPQREKDVLVSNNLQMEIFHEFNFFTASQRRRRFGSAPLLY
jgi:hypothetical protein